MLGLASDSSPCLAEGLCVSGKQKITTQSHFPNEMKFPNCKVQRAVGLHRHDTVSQKPAWSSKKKPSLIVKKENIGRIQTTFVGYLSILKNILKRYFKSRGFDISPVFMS